MKIEIEVSDVMLARLEHVARARNVAVETLAHAYVEDWLNIEYAETMGRMSRRAMYRDGPLAFDPEAREAAQRIEADLQPRLGS